VGGETIAPCQRVCWSFPLAATYAEGQERAQAQRKGNVDLEADIARPRGSPDIVASARVVTLHHLKES
jgi:hypothetical protein